MSALPQIKRLLAEDYKEAGTWISKLLYPLNLFMSSVYAALNHGITFQDNVLAQVKTLTVKGSSPAVQFPWPYASAPIGVLIIASSDTSAIPKTITAAVTCAWSYSAGTVSINNITGLDAARQYSLTFLVLGG